MFDTGDYKTELGEHVDGFTYRLDKAERLDLAYRLADVLSWYLDQDDDRWRDDVRVEISTSVETLDYAETRAVWARCHYPEPTHVDDEFDNTGHTIHELMQIGIVFSFIDWTERLTSEATTRREALEILNAYLAANGWNQIGHEGNVSNYGERHNKETERCTGCPTHCN